MYCDIFVNNTNFPWSTRPRRSKMLDIYVIIDKIIKIKYSTGEK